MDNQRLHDQLDRIVHTLLGASPVALRGDGASIDREVAPLITVAEELRALPREDFKSRLKADLERSTNMATSAPQTTSVSTSTREFLPRPAGYRSLTPYLTVKNAPELLDFVQRAFGAKVLEQVNGPAGRMHAEAQIGDSVVMMGGSPEGPWFPTSIHLKVDAVDKVYERAVAAGAKSVHGPQEMDYGERAATVIDASGNNWYIATPHSESHWLAEMSDVTIYLHPRSSNALMDFAKRAFGAQEIMRAEEGGVVHHAKLRVGDSVIEMGDAHGDHDPMPTMFYLYVPNVDASYNQALASGATSLAAPAAMPYGDYVGSVADPFGNQWYMAAPTRAHRPERTTPQPSAPAASSSTAKASYIRPGFRTLTPYMLVNGAAREIEFLKNGVGATETLRVPGPGGQRIRHAQMQIGDAVVELSDATPEFPARAMMNILYVPDPDAAYARAMAAGATRVYPVSDKPWGDRDGVVASPGGVAWCLSSRGKGEHLPADTPPIVPGFTVKDAAGYVEFMKRAFGATEVFMHKAPDGTLIHGRVRIGDSILAGGELERRFDRVRQATPFLMHMYVPDVDAVYASALEAGATTVRGLEDAPYGDRTASIADPYGNLWSLATHIREVKF
ncbi:MAG: VOC family protein [Candidatus Acidiferrales bacterium]